MVLDLPELVVGAVAGPLQDVGAVLFAAGGDVHTLAAVQGFDLEIAGLPFGEAPALVVS